ncbi:MAG: phosphoribosylamine--glycine ligase [Leptospiraceae bacterium]|nr:phosphoribosylamine--glycine ligase [Leptospiraceae bacterium]
MKVLLIGSGGRESAIAYKIRKSPLLRELKVYPGNAGFPSSELVPKDAINLKDKISVQDYVKKNGILFVVVGPEEPLVDGIADWLQEIDVPCFGPSKYCAQLEGSKAFAKNLMQSIGVPTARYATFSDFESAKEYIQNHPLPIVVKYDGLAAGKGVSVCQTKEEAEKFLESIFVNHKFANDNTVVLEEFLEGEEASIFALCDGERFLMLPAAQDHKRAFDNDQGPNTGGMGAYAPAPLVTQEVYEKVKTQIFESVFRALRESGHPYRGLLYAGLMIDKLGNPKVVEFNVRFGDPETQAVLMLLEDDLLELMWECASEKLTRTSLKMKEGSSAVVVLAAEGYPESYKKNIPLNLKEPTNPNTILFHAGTSIQNGSLVSTGGRILGVTSFGVTLKEAVDSCYEYLKENPIPSTFYRTDIAKRAL